MLDATLLSKVYLRLTTGKQENLNFTNNKFTNSKNENAKNYKSIFSIPRKNLMYLSDVERQQHKRFIDEIKDPLWKKIT